MLTMTSSPPAMSSPPKPSNQSSSVPIPENQSHSTSSIPYPSDISSPNSILRPQNIDIFNANTIPFVNSLGWRSVSVQGHGNMPKIWNSCDFNLEKETSCGVDPGLAFRSRLNLPFESNSTWPLPSLMQGAQYPPPPMVNVSSTSSSSSLQNLHMELPSNQSCYGNYTPVWPEEEKLS
ncbi:uncharacterized protein LOC131174147 [Hevea brasiliensis]|uniref:uncharacterized protein LOC131174147 n=1 Tax=Hevea brasiliensis TaxID=3981 RepID=UPI0025E8A6B1|nr:uncharacterized protein LOC131174147 [Hevea brasiliensis]